MVSALRIDSVILHGIKKRTRGETVDPDLSGAESQLSDMSRGFLQEQVRVALKHGRQIQEEAGLSPVQASSASSSPEPRICSTAPSDWL